MGAAVTVAAVFVLNLQENVLLFTQIKGKNVENRDREVRKTLITTFQRGAQPGEEFAVLMWLPMWIVVVKSSFAGVQGACGEQGCWREAEGKRRPHTLQVDSYCNQTSAKSTAVLTLPSLKYYIFSANWKPVSVYFVGWHLSALESDGFFHSLCTPKTTRNP